MGRPRGDDASLEVTQTGDELILAAGGRWLIQSARALDERLRRIDPRGAAAIRLDLAGLEALDTAGAWLLLRVQRRWAEAGRAARFDNVGADFAPLLDQIAAGASLPQPADPHRARYRLGDFTARVGRVTVGLVRTAGSLLSFVGLVSIVAFRTLRQPSRLRFAATVAQMEKVGFDALPIVGLLSFLIGVVFAFQGADQLSQFGAQIYTVNLLGIAILRELGVMMAAVIIAGRSGSAFTAQIGTMVVNEEVDAMRVLGLDPVEVLVLPRFFALLLTLPLVAFYANLMGLLGGALMAWAALDISIPAFLRQLRSPLPGWSFWVGVLKAPVFAGIIALTGCYEGLRVARSAESVGRQTTRSVVESIFLIILADALFSVIFSYLGI